MLPLLVLASCATTPQATADERAACEDMERRMGLHTTHDHQQMKGTGANPMNLTHERCRQILDQDD
jgi:hypothetical protein